MGSEQVYIRDGRAPVPVRESTSRVMSANRARNTSPETALVTEVRSLGLRGYRLHRKGIPGRPDLSFGPQKVAIFVNGCFWHHCPRCQRGLPKTHTEFWKAKFDANQRRDAEKSRFLVNSGWQVLTIWECEIRSDVQAAAEQVARIVKSPRPHRAPARSALPSGQAAIQ
jgi:DNA mismatch endonuclease, patch repair protein